MLLVLPGIFAGTAQALNGVKTATSRLTGTNFVPNINEGLGDGPNQIPAKSTGYFQFRVLQRLIESYVELKKKNQSVVVDGVPFHAKDLRLAFAVWKDQSVYLVSGVQFQLKRSSHNPMEYMYTLQMRAWKRIRPDGGTSAGNLNIAALHPNLFASLLAKMNQVNVVLSASKKTLLAVGQDIGNRVGEVGREVTMFLKNLQGINAVINDYPNIIKRDIAISLHRNWAQVSGLVADLGVTPPSIISTGLNKALGQKKQALIDSDLTPYPVTNSTLQELSDLFDKVKPEDIPLTLPLIAQIKKERDRVSALGRSDFEERRDELKQVYNDFANYVGATGDTYNAIYGLTDNAVREPTDDDLDSLASIAEMIQILDHLAVNSKQLEKIPSSLEYVAGLAEQNGIAFKTPQSKYAVPFPYGYTLERLALQYLGDANRWYEIATLNGLRTPFIDEEGFKLPFLTNGDGNILYVSDASNLYVNQTVYISSRIQNRSKRHIIDINEIYAGYIAVTVDGTDDMDAYTTANLAVLEAFLPGTVNSQQIIYIPSDTPAVEPFSTRTIPGVDEYDPLLQVSGVDLLLSPDGDLAITPDGDVRLAYGLQNIVQTVKIGLTTPRGSLLQHPSFGINLDIGMSTAEVTAEDIIKQVSELFAADSAFTGVKSANVVKSGNTVAITVIIGVKGISENIPLTFNITR